MRSCLGDPAGGASQEMTRLTIPAPDELATVGYDEIEVAAAAVPLCSVRQPRQELGRAAAQLLLEESAGATAHEHRQVTLLPELEIGQSRARRYRTSGSGAGPSGPRKPGAGKPGAGKPGSNEKWPDASTASGSTLTTAATLSGP
jgi:hypothetical protein